MAAATHKNFKDTVFAAAKKDTADKSTHNASLLLKYIIIVLCIIVVLVLVFIGIRQKK